MSNSSRSETSNGLFFGLSATLLWGSYPLWYKPLSHINAWELLSWRILFAELFLFLLLLVTFRYKQIGTEIRKISFANVGIMSLILGFWWILYIYGISTARVLEIAMGYFISPLMSLVVSRVIFKEKLSYYQTLAVTFAATGVLLMAFKSFNLNSIPWLAISIGFCFSFYGIFKKRVPTDPIITQTLEIMILLPFAGAFLLWLHNQDQSYELSDNFTISFLLIATGMITVLPLWWYNLAARKLPLKTLSFLQFVPPTCNFLIGVFVYREPFDAYKVAVFSLIWVGVAIFMSDAIIKNNMKNAIKRKLSIIEN